MNTENLVERYYWIVEISNEESEEGTWGTEVCSSIEDPNKLLIECLTNGDLSSSIVELAEEIDDYGEISVLERLERLVRIDLEGKVKTFFDVSKDLDKDLILDTISNMYSE